MKQLADTEVCGKATISIADANTEISLLYGHDVIGAVPYHRYLLESSSEDSLPFAFRSSLESAHLDEFADYLSLGFGSDPCKDGGPSRHEWTQLQKVIVYCDCQNVDGLKVFSSDFDLSDGNSIFVCAADHLA